MVKITSNALLPSLAFRPDELNCNAYETLAFNNVTKHRDNAVAF